MKPGLRVLPATGTGQERLFLSRRHDQNLGRSLPPQPGICGALE
jgi:hypothetical protein